MTYAARHRITRRRVAVKLVPPDAPPAHSAALRARLAREAQALAMVSHPGVVEVLDGGVAPHGPYLVTALLEGCTLAEIAADHGPLSVTEAVSVASSAAAALEAVHRAGIVHRAVSPASLLILRDRMGNEQLKLIGFDIAQLRAPHLARITHIGAVVSAPAHTALEQLLAYGDVDARADVYALGATLFECLTGQRPFPGRSYEDILLSAVAEEVPPLLTLCPDAGTRLAAVVQRATARDRSRRFQTTSDFRRALHEAAPWASTQTRLLEARSSRRCVDDGSGTRGRPDTFCVK